MSIEDEINASEQELVSIFGRALQGPLEPIRTEIEKTRLEVQLLQDEVQNLQAVLHMLGDEHEDALKRLKELRVYQGEAFTQLVNHQEECRDRILTAQDTHATQFDSNLNRVAAERTDWLITILNNATDRQMQASAECKNSLSHQVLALQASMDTAEQQVHQVSRELRVQAEALAQLKDGGEGLQLALSEMNRVNNSLREDHHRSTQAQIQAAMRSVRRMLVATVILVGGTLAASVASHWPWPFG